jgi:hypothetical protein
MNRDILEGGRVDSIGEAFDDAVSRLEKYLGEADAADVILQALALARLRIPESPDDLFLLACILVEDPSGGIVEAVGHALKVKALLLGAKS